MNSKMQKFVIDTILKYLCANYFRFDTRMLWGLSKKTEVGDTGREKSISGFIGGVSDCFSILKQRGTIP